MSRSASSLLIISLAVFASALFLFNPKPTLAASKFWIGPNGGNFSSNSNWSTISGGINNTVAPGSSDLAIFDGANTNSANVDVAFAGALGGLLIDAELVDGIPVLGYNGTITLQRSLSVAASHFYQEWGTFALGSNTLTIGTNGSASNFTITGGTFNSDTGTLATGGSGTHAVDVVTSLTLYNFTSGATSGTTTIASGDTLVVTNNLTFTGATINGPGYIEMRGATTTVGSTGTLGSVQVEYLVDGDQTISGSGGKIPGILVNKTTGTVSQSGNINVNAGSFTLQSGAYALGSATLTLGSNASTVNFTISGGSFNGGTGTLAIGGNGNTTIDIVTSQTLYNFTVNAGAGTATVSSGDTLVVTNNLDLTTIGTALNGPGVIEMRGTSTTVGTGGIGNIAIQYLVDGDQAITSSSSGTIPGIVINKSSGTVTQSGTLSINAGHFSLQSGTYSLGSSTLIIGTNGSVANFTVSGGTFNAGTGTLAFGGSAAAAVDVATSQNLYNLTLNKTSGTVTIATGDTLVLGGTLLLTDGVISGGTIQAQGDVTIGAAANGGTSVLQFTGSTTTQNFTDSGGTKTSGNITINKSSGEVKLLTAMSYNNTGQTLTVTAGTLNLNSFTLTINGALTVGASGVLKLFGAETITRGSLSLSDGSTVLYTGDGDSAGDSYTLTTLTTTYYNLTVTSTDGATDTFAISATPLTINGSINITAGAVTGGTATIAVSGNWSNTGTFTADTSTVSLTGINQQINGTTTFYNLSKIVTAADTLTFASGTTQTISNTWTAQGASEQFLSLRASATPTQWSIDPQGTRTIAYLDVQDSNNINGATISISGFSIANSGNNTGWDFATVVSVTGQNPQTTAGGKSITITGTNFVDVPTITIGGTSATSVFFVSVTSLTAVAPAKGAGSYDVVITNPDNNTVTCTNCMTYIAPPIVTSIDQTYISSGGGVTRAISGSGMLVGSAGVKIDPSGTAQTATTSGLSTATTFTTPAHTAGNVIIRVYGTSGTDANGIYTDTSNGFLVYEDLPTFTSIDEPYLPTVSPATRTLTGTNIKIGASGILVDGTTVTTSGSATAATFTPPDHAAGSVTIRIYSPNGTDANGLYLDQAAALTYEAKPTVSSVSPSSGLPVAGGTTITIEGTGLKVGAAAGTIDPSGTANSITTAGLSTAATFTTPAHTAGSVTLRVYSTNGTTANGLYVDYSSLTFAATPTVTSITGQNPQTTAGGKSITINGTNFVNTPISITIGGTNATSIIFVSSTELTATAPAKAAGSYDVVVENPDTQTGTCTNCMTYIVPPTVTSIDETYASSSGGQTRIISGSGMKSSGTALKVDTTSTSAGGGSDSSSLVFTTPAHTAGNVVIRVYGTSGTDANGIYTDTSSGFLVYEDMPTFTSIDQPYLPTVSPATRTLTGTNIKVGSSGVSIDGTSVTTFGSSSSITFTPPDHAAGSVTVRIYSAHGTDDNGLYHDEAAAMTYEVKPTVSDVTPNAGLPTTGGTTLTITGTNMKVGAAGATVDPGGTADNVTTSGLSSSATFVTSAHGAGSVVLRVYSAHGTTANGLYVDYSSLIFSLTPTIVSITGQNPQTTAGGKVIVINGTNFVSGATVKVNGVSTVGLVIFVSETELTATATANAAGSYDVVVTNPDEQTASCVECMTYIAPPTVTSIDETYADSGGGQTRAISGVGMKVGVNGLVIDPSGTAQTATTSGLSTATTFTTPAHTAGNVIIRVYGTSGTDANGIYTDTSNGFLVYEDLPTFTSIDEPYLPTVSPATRTLTGTNIKIGASGILVDGTTVTTSGSATAATFTPPDHAAGSVTIRIYSPNGTDANGLYLDQAAALTYEAKPTVSSIDEQYASTAGLVARVVNGLGMKVGAAGLTIDPAGTADNVVTSGTSASISFTVPAHASGAVILRIYSVNGTAANGIYTDTDSGFLTYETPPAVTLTSPNSGTIAGGTTVTITGTSLKVGSNGLVVDRIGTNTAATTSGSSSEITFSTAVHDAGVVAIRFYSAHGSDSNGLYVDEASAFIYVVISPVVTPQAGSGGAYGYLDGLASPSLGSGAGYPLIKEPVKELAKTTTACVALPRNIAREKAAITLFKQLEKKTPKTAVDWKRVHLLAYGHSSCELRSLAKEKNGLKLFVAKYKRLPRHELDWRVVNYFAYR